MILRHKVNDKPHQIEIIQTIRDSDETIVKEIYCLGESMERGVGIVMFGSNYVS